MTVVERDKSGAAVAVVGPFGARHSLDINAQGQLERVQDAGGATCLLGYAGGLLQRVTNPNGHSKQCFYDGLGAVVRAQDMAGGETQFTRTTGPQGIAVTVTTGEGVQAQHSRSVVGGRLVRQVTTGSGSGTATRDTRGVRSSTARDGTQTTVTLNPHPRYGMDAPLRRTQVRLPSGLTRVTESSAVVELGAGGDDVVTETRTTTLNGKTATGRWDAASGTWTTASAQGRTVVTTLDAQGQVSGMTRAGMAPLAVERDAAGRAGVLRSGAGATQRVVSLAYDAQGRLSGVTDPLERTTAFTHDGAGRVTSQTLEDGTTVALRYDAAGNVVGVTPPGQPEHQFTYTPVNLEEAYVPPDVGFTPRDTVNVYNRDKQLVRTIRPDGKQVVYAHDSTGRVANVTFSRGTTTYAYDPASGHLTSVAAPGGVTLGTTYDGALVTGQTWSGPVNGSVGFTYNADFRVASRSVNGSNTVAYAYDNDGLLTSVGDMTITRNAFNGLVEGTQLGNVVDSYGYNTFGEVTSYEARYTSTVMFAQAFVRDDLGRITTKTETVLGETHVFGYGYDLVGRLERVTKDGVVTSVYAYDANGNRLSHVKADGTIVTADYDAQDRMLRYGDNVYTWTNNGEMESKTNTATGEVTTYTWDEFGNLIQVVLPDARVIEYVMDGQNRRIGKKVNGVLVQGFLWETQLRIAAALDATGDMAALFAYSSSPNSPSLFAKDGAAYRMLKNHLGSPLLLMSTTTSTVAHRLEHDEFGVITTDTLPAFLPFGFAGGLHDLDTGLLRFGVRDYDATTGRWLGKDPIRFRGGDSNMYAYAYGDPINIRDPSGNLAIELIFGAVAAAAVVALIVNLVEKDAAEAERLVRRIQRRQHLSWGQCSQSNALLHCIGYCSAVRNYGETIARAASAWHEMGSDSTDSRVDRYNNEQGAQCAANRSQECEEQCMDRLRTGELAFDPLMGPDQNIGCPDEGLLGMDSFE